MKDELNKEIAAHARRHDGRKCSYRWISTPQLVDDIASMLPEHVATPSAQMVGWQFTTNNYRHLKVQKYYGRFDVVRKVQSHTITKCNVDARHANANCRTVRGWFIRNKHFTKFVSRDDKNKIKVGSPGDPLALANTRRRAFVVKDVKFEASDHDMCIKTHLSPTVMFDINPPENGSNKLGNFYNGTVTTMLKESAIDMSSAFQHASEFIINHKDMKEVFLVLQGDGGYDFNCTTPRNIASAVMIMIHLVLEHVVSIRNSGGNSMFNPVERVMSHLDFGLSVMACDRESASEEVEKAITKAKSVKKFVTDNIKNETMMQNYMSSVQPVIDEINDTFKLINYCEKGIKIGKVATKDCINDHVKYLREMLPWLPKDVLNANSDDVFGSSEGKEFLRIHTLRGKYKVEMFRNVNCPIPNCKFCSIKPRLSMRFMGVMPYPTKLKDDSYSDPKDVMPLGSNPKETDCPSINKGNKQGKHYKNQVRLNNSTLIATWKCIGCSMDRGMFACKREISKEQLEWTLETYLPTYDFQCGDYLCPDNDVNRVIFPNDSWKEEEHLIEFRHNLTCATPL